MSPVPASPASQLRISPRVQFVRPVHVRQLEEKSPAKRLFASNLSVGGMFIRTPRPLALGTRLAVLFEANGRILPFGEAEVCFQLPVQDANSKKRLPGCGVRCISGMSQRAR